MALSGKIVCGSFDVVINGKAAARKSDLTDHAALISEGCPTVVINGGALLAARAADAINCPSPEDGGHSYGFVFGPGSPDVLIGGHAAAREGDETTCVGGGGGGGGGDGGGGGGGGGEEAPESECAKLWKKYQDEALALIAPGDHDHRARNRIINGAYANLYLNNPEFKWAGLAAYASKQVGCAMDFALSAGADPNRPPNPLLAYNPGGGLGPAYQFTYEMLGIGNRALFLDIYPLHRFFQEQGFAKMAHCAGERKPPVPAQALDGFRAIDLYKRTGDPKFLDQSVRSIAWHEQVNVLQRDIYNDARMQALLRGNEYTGWTGAARPASVVMGPGCTDPTGGKQTLTFGDGGRTKIYNVDERMDWILNDVYKNYSSFAGTKRHLDDLREIRRQGAMVGADYP